MKRASIRALGTTRNVDRLVLGVGVVVLFVLFLWPPLMLALASFRAGNLAGQGAWTFGPFIETLTSGRTWRVSLNSIVLSVTSSFVGMAVGMFLAWVAVRTTTPLRRWMTPIMAALLVVPPLFYGLGWYLVVNGTTAPLNVILNQFMDVTGSPFGSGWPIMLIVVTGYVIPVGYLFMVGPLAQLDGALDDAARISGASRVTAFFTVTVPLMRPAMFGVFALMTSYGFSAFELPLMFGIPSDIHVFSTAVYTTLTAQEAIPNYAGASTLSLLLMILVLLLVLLRSWVLRGKSFATIGGKGLRSEARSYGKVQWAFTGVFFLVVCWAGLIPLTQMVLGSFQPLFGVSAELNPANYLRIFDSSRTFRLIGFTLVLAAIGGFLAASVALVSSHLTQRGGRFLRYFTSTLSWAPVAIPGVLVGLALITAYIPVPGLRALIGTPTMLLLGFIVVATPIATRAIEGGVVQISGELEESARISGASKYNSFFTVVVPLVLPSFFAGWFIAGVGIAGNLSLPVLLSSPSMQTVAVQAYDSYRQGYASESAALFLILMLAVLIAGALAWVLIRSLMWVRQQLKATMLAKPFDTKGKVRDVSELQNV